jgi:hypothetical protein
MFRELENVRRGEDWIEEMMYRIKDRFFSGQKDEGHDEFGGDHEGGNYGPGGMPPPDSFDPERANQEMIDAIPEFMAILPEKF